MTHGKPPLQRTQATQRDAALPFQRPTSQAMHFAVLSLLDIECHFAMQCLCIDVLQRRACANDFPTCAWSRGRILQRSACLRDKVCLMKPPGAWSTLEGAASAQASAAQRQLAMAETT